MVELIEASLNVILCELDHTFTYSPYLDSSLIKIKTESKTLRHLNEDFKFKEI